MFCFYFAENSSAVFHRCCHSYGCGMYCTDNVKNLCDDCIAYRYFGSKMLFSARLKLNIVHADLSDVKHSILVLSK